jgi:hypothetical protein
MRDAVPAARLERGEPAPGEQADDPTPPMRAGAPRATGDPVATADGATPPCDEATAADDGPPGVLDWRVIDRRLRVIAGRRGQLDAEEARWLRAAELHQIWRPLGMVSAIDYLDRVLGHAPHTARERLRVARALGGLPSLSEALEVGELSYSAVRELTRVATPATQASWRARAIGLPLRELEALVAHREPGDRPDDPARPEPRSRALRLELAPEAYALWRETARMLGEAHARRLSDSELVTALCGAARVASDRGGDGAAMFQIAVTVCERCGQGWQDGGGQAIPISAAAVERAACDAQHIGSLDAAEPARATQDIPPSVVRLVRRRDHGRCRVPGCRSAFGIELHHVVHRSAGGAHVAGNLICLCSSCHAAHHDGRLRISGSADQLVVERPGEPQERASRVGHARGTGDEADRRSGEAEPVLGERGDAPREGGASRVGRARGTRDEADRRCGDAKPVLGERGDAPREGASHTGPTRRTRDEADRRCGDAKPVLGERNDAPREGASHTGPARRTRDEAVRGLTGLGWPRGVAVTSVDAAIAALGESSPLAELVSEALRRCPRPRG